jgi:hypothetical protein
MSDSPATQSFVATHFQLALAEHGGRGPVGQILRLLADGSLTADAFDVVAADHGVRREEWFRGQILDLFLGLVRALLATSRLRVEHRAPLQALRRQLAIPDGEFMVRRPAEVAAIVDEQLEQMLSDGIIDGPEELEQVELQAAFGLAYDDYLLISRRAVERAYTELTDLTSRSPDTARKRRLLEPLYLLVTSRPRSAGALF